MTRALAVLLLLAGCEAKGALELVVAHSQGVTSVRLYIGVGDATEQPIAPEGFAAPIAPTTWWPLDPHASLDVRETPGTDDAVFQIERGANGETDLEVAILVGFDKEGQALAAAKLADVAIPNDSIARHFVTLTPLAAQTALVRTWPHGDNKCVAYADRVPQMVTSMVVDKADPDCDNVTDPTLDCAPDAFSVTRPAKLDDVACLTAQTVFFDPGGGTGLNVQGCVLGGPTCMDGRGQEPRGTCSATPYCAPASACSRCAANPNGLACAANYYAGTDFQALPFHIDCRVQRSDVSGVLCNEPSVVQLDNLLRDNGTRCTGPILISHGSGFGPTTMIANSSVQGTATLSVSGLDENCRFTIQAMATLVPPMTNAAPGIAGIVAGMLDNGRGFAIPITVTGEIGAPCPGTCSVSTSIGSGEYIKECLYSPVLPP